MAFVVSVLKFEDPNRLPQVRSFVGPHDGKEFNRLPPDNTFYLASKGTLRMPIAAKSWRAGRANQRDAEGGGQNLAIGLRLSEAASLSE